jgi:hypothetical protein
LPIISAQITHVEREQLDALAERKLLSRSAMLRLLVTSALAIAPPHVENPGADEANQKSSEIDAGAAGVARTSMGNL